MVIGKGMGGGRLDAAKQLGCEGTRVEGMGEVAGQFGRCCLDAVAGSSFGVSVDCDGQNLGQGRAVDATRCVSMWD